MFTALFAIAALWCIHCAIMKKLGEISVTAALPTEEEWKNYPKPNSTTMCIEFTYQVCGARFETHNEYVSFVDGAELLGRATYELFGKYCKGKNMIVLESLDHAHLDTI